MSMFLFHSGHQCLPSPGAQKALDTHLSGILQVGQESHQSMRSGLLDPFSGCTLHGLWRFICGYVFVSLHHSLYIFLKVRRCLFFLPHWISTLLAVHCGRHIVISGTPLVTVPMGLKTLPLYSDKSNTCFSNSPATCDEHWPERKSASAWSPYNRRGYPFNKTKLILFARLMGSSVNDHRSFSFWYQI